MREHPEVIEARAEMNRMFPEDPGPAFEHHMGVSCFRTSRPTQWPEADDFPHQEKRERVYTPRKVSTR